MNDAVEDEREAESFLYPRSWTIGMRVVVRYRVPGGFSDALGEIRDLSAEQVTIQTRRRGEVTVAWQEVVTGKRVPPPPVRPHRDR